VVISSAGYRHLASRAPATVQSARAQYQDAGQAESASASERSAHVFVDEMRRAFAPDAQTGMIDLDCSANPLGGSPSTTCNLLVRYLVVREGEEFEFTPQATSVLFYAIKGTGRAFQESELVEWTTADAFQFSGGESILVEAPDADAVLLVVTDEPFVSMTGCTVPPQEDAPVKSTHYEARTIAAKIGDLVAQHVARWKDKEVTGQDGAPPPDEQAAPPPAQIVLNFGNGGFGRIGCVSPMMHAGIAMLEPGAHQSTHCHDADTVSLCLECDGVYSTIDGNRTDWLANTVILTPADALHSQHTGTEARMFSFFVQDRGPRAVRTWQPGETAG
jgi:gentisate 1,2-dioxygenase